MKKNIFKLMTVALAVGALASCADNLPEVNGLNVKKGDLVATLPGSTNETRVAVISGGQFVWADDDQIQVYETSSLNFSTYTLEPGTEGTTTGVFNLTSGPDQSESENKLYAVTQPRNSETIYGVSADAEGNAVLTATIQKEYPWATIESNGKTAYKVPTPFWGEATINKSNNTINVDFQALTGFLKLDLRALPMGTKAIVLTNHEDIEVGDGGSPVVYTEYNGGSNEPLSGTMRAVLNDGVGLAVDNHLAKYDEIRVNIEEVTMVDGEDYILYIPVVAQHYDKLYILAVKEDNRANYTWDDAEILRELDDYTMTINQTIPVIALSEVLDLNALGATSWLEASQLIADNYDGKHTMRFKVDGSAFAAGDLYIANNLSGQTSAEIEFIDATTLQSVVECKANTLSSGDFKNFSTSPVDLASAQLLSDAEKVKARTITLKFDVDVAADLDIILPTSYVVIDSEEDQTGAIKVFAANNKNGGVGGYDATNLNAKDASVTIKGGKLASGESLEYTAIDIYPNSRGDVYVYEEDTQIATLTFLGAQKKGNLRITDALIDNIVYESTAANNQISIYTTGSAAIKTGITGDANKAKIYAYWTGRALTDNALDEGYDCGTIFTAAQLQGVGLAAGLNEGGGTHTFASGHDLTALAPVYEYIISDRVNNIWLGGKTFPWLGAQVAKLIGDTNTEGLTDRTIIDPDKTEPLYSTAWYTPQALTAAVVIDGNGKNLHNMLLTLDDPYFVDPHSCCTTCGDMSVKVTEDLGLVRCIITTETAKVKNIMLNDVLLESNVNVDNVGAIVGEIGAEGDVTLASNNATNIRIETLGDNIGGQVGNLVTRGATDIDDVLVGQEVVETGVNDIYVKTTGDNCGGVIGNLESTGAVSVDNAIVHLDEVSATYGSNVGGLIGDLYFETNARFGTIDGAENEVIVDVIKATQKSANQMYLEETGNNVGGIVGQAIGKDVNMVINTAADGNVATVESDEISGENQHVGGLVGFEYTGAANAIFNNKETDLIDVTVGKLQANNGFVGGLAGYIPVANLIKVNAVPGDIDVDLDELNGAFAAGGLLGSHDAVANISATEEGTINVTIDALANTWNESDFTATTTKTYLALSLEDRLKACGSFGTLDGLKNGNLTIAGVGNINVDGDAISATEAADVISAKHYSAVGRPVIKEDIKKALFFQLHKDAHSSTIGEGDTFWGDLNGFVGYDKQDAQYVIGSNLQGDQIKNVYIAY